MKKSNMISIVLLLLSWQLVGMNINNDIILPLPFDVLRQMVSDVQNPLFLRIIISTSNKALISFSVALLLAIVLGLLAGMTPIFEHLLRPIEVVLKTIPNITYMFMLLMWLSSETAVYYVIFFIVYPVIYSNVLQGMKTMDQDRKDVLRMYGETLRAKIVKIYLPQIYPFIKSSILSTLSLSIKVGVMAEVLGQVKYGIGKEMYLNKLNLDMTGVFSWTIWIIILVSVFEKVLKHVLPNLEE